MSIVVTGGAGFVGSCVVRKLNDMGITDIIIVDNISNTGKWMNIRNKKYLEYIHKHQFLEKLSLINGVEAIIHMGAQSSTLECDFDYLWNNNFEYTKTLWNYCSSKHISFIYASSAATYGDGGLGFDDNMDIDRLLPLNVYGYSKQLFDLWVKHQAKCQPKQYVGLKFFNVYGPNEYFKGNMASMVYHGYKQIMKKREICLFKSYNQNYKDGGQLRDFVYVKDVCDVIIWFLQHSDKSGLFNVGTGCAQSFDELATALFHALDMEPKINYIDMPEALKDKYQYYTQADIKKLRSVGYHGCFKDLETGVKDYVVTHLEKNFSVY